MSTRANAVLTGGLSEAITECGSQRTIPRPRRREMMTLPYFQLLNGGNVNGRKHAALEWWYAGPHSKQTAFLE